MLAPNVPEVRVASAAEILNRSDLALRRLVHRGEIFYMPIAGERRFNQLLIEERNTTAPALPRMILSFDERVVDDQRV